MSMSCSRKVAWIVWMIASVFYAYQYILRVMPNMMLNDIMLQFDMNAATFGQFSGVYYIGYSLMHLPIGIMLDRYGPRKIMTGCVFLTIIGLMPLLFAEYWLYPIIGRLFIGIGSSAAILGIFKIVRMAFSEALFPRMLSFSVTIGLIGAIYGGGPVSYMRDVFGYHAVVQIFIGVGIVLAGMTYWIIPDFETSSQGTVVSDIKEVLTNKRVIGSCVSAGLMVGPLEGFADAWGSVFFKQVYGFDSSIAASMPSMIFIGMCFGAPILSMIADKLGNYLVTIIGAGILMVASFFLLLSSQMTPTVLSVSFIIVGICCAYQILAIYKASTYVRPEVAGLTTALANMIIMIFGYAFHSMIGGVVSAMGGPGSSVALTYGVTVIPVALTVGVLGFVMLWLQEKRAESTSFG